MSVEPTQHPIQRLGNRHTFLKAGLLPLLEKADTKSRHYTRSPQSRRQRRRSSHVPTPTPAFRKRKVVPKMSQIRQSRPCFEEKVLEIFEGVPCSLGRGTQLSGNLDTFCYWSHFGITFGTAFCQVFCRSLEISERRTGSRADSSSNATNRAHFLVSLPRP